ncbi:MAG TPA: DUF1501 domain-containing protein [Blastocatellia bacterium]|nr:DUF1501 domain-containing protein [Blastocatellia bacterium]
MSFTRREFLKCCGRGMSAATMLTALGYALRENAYAQTGDYKALVCLFLEGGNDGWNTVVPLDQAAYNTYATTRTGLALSQGSLLPVSAPGQGNFGFHPSLAGIRTLWNQGHVAVVCNVGNLIEPVTAAQVLSNPERAPSGLFDHFQQQTFSQNLLNENTRGWGNSLGSNFPLFNTAPLIPMLMTMVNNTPWLKGPGQTITLQPNLQLGITGLPATGALPLRFDTLKQVAALPETSIQVNAFNGRVSRAIDDSRVIGSVFSSQPFTTQFPNTTVGQQLRQIAIAIAARNALGHDRRQLFYAQVGGNAYDTHGAQLTTQATLLSQLDAAMSAFYATTVELGVATQVTTFTFSEFGRTMRINGDGSDHGWSNHYLVMGGSVVGGQFYGTYPPVQVGTPFDFPLFSVAGNFRGANVPENSMDQYGNTLAQWFGLSAAAADDVFPNLNRFPTRDLGFLG